MSPHRSISLIESCDAALLAQLHAACFADAWDAQAFGELLGRAGVTAYLAYEEEEIAVGFALLRAIAGEAEILTLGVLPQFRKKAVGAALVDVILRWAADNHVDSIFLEVRASNIAAQALYRKAGFTQIALRKEYYRAADGGSEHGVVMRRLPTD